MTPDRGSEAERKLTEAEFQRQVTDLAELLGWEWAHFRPALTAKGWRTPVSGPLGKGWPDLVLVHAAKKRLIFAELKSEKGRLTWDQARVHETLTTLDWHHWKTEGIGWVLPRLELHTWRPTDFDEIQMALR